MKSVDRVVAEMKVKQEERKARLRATQFYNEVVDGLAPLVTRALDVYAHALALDPESLQADAEATADAAPPGRRRSGRDHAGTLRLQALRLQMQAAKAIIGTARQFMGKAGTPKDDDDAEDEPADAGDVQEIRTRFGL